MRLNEDAITGRQLMQLAVHAKLIEHTHRGHSPPNVMMLRCPQEAHASQRCRCFAQRSLQHANCGFCKVPGVAGVMVDELLRCVVVGERRSKPAG
jgi:hypothetical protein